MKILLAEDEIQMNKVVTTALQQQAYEVTSVSNGQEAVDQALKNHFDVMILDIMMPVKSGIDALKEIRDSGNTSHVIMLTAMSEIDDRVNGLDAGADDYLTKPFSLKELLARLRSMERRVESFTPRFLEMGNVRLDNEEQELVAGNSIRLSSKETKLLEFLLLNQGKILSTDTILQQIWSDGDNVEETTLQLYISYLRQKLEAVNASIDLIGDLKSGFYLADGGEVHV